MQFEKRLVLAAWDRLEWRHHGAGMLQAYLPEDTYPMGATERELKRVHIWHRSLVKPGIVEGGAKHNHRFHLRSLVLHGSILNTVLKPRYDEAGGYQLWRIEGASNRAKATLVKEDRVTVVEHGTQRYHAGQEYALLKWDYHWGRQTEWADIGGHGNGAFTVTLVDMVEKEGTGGAPRSNEGKWARLLCPVGFEPVHAFEEQMQREQEIQFTRLIGNAREALAR